MCGCGCRCFSQTTLGRLLTFWYVFVLLYSTTTILQLSIVSTGALIVVALIAMFKARDAGLPDPRDLAQYAMNRPCRAWIAFFASFFILITFAGINVASPEKLKLAVVLVQATSVYRLSIMGGIVVGIIFLFRQNPQIHLWWKVLVLFPLIFILCSEYDAVFHPCDIPLGAEFPDPRFGEDYEKLEKSVLAHIMAATGGGVSNASRAVHPKQHGCVKAKFVVNDQLSPRFRYGIFAKQGRDYDAWLRFSNGATDVQADSKGDVRGFAVKVLGVEGPKILDSHEPYVEGKSQDFVMITSPFFFTSDTHGYDAFINSLSGGKAPILKWVFNSLNPTKWLLPEVSRIMKLFRHGATISNPLATEYFSATPYRFGPENQAVKWGVVPCPTNNKVEAVSRHGPDFLRHNLNASLLAGPACFDFRVQEQVDACHNKVEDSTVPWDGPWVSLARIYIPQQDVLSRDQFEYCENLGYNIWNSSPETRPIGNLNRARKVYHSAYKARSQINHVAFEEPIANPPINVHPHVYEATVGGGDTKHYQYKRYDPPYADLPKQVSEFNRPRMAFTLDHKLEIVGEVASFGRQKIRERRAISKAWHETTTLDERYGSYFSKPGEKGIPLAWWVPRWREDVVWAAQWVKGVNPLSIISVKAVPAGVQLSSQNVSYINKEILPKDCAGCSLESILSSSRVFLADYWLLEDIPMGGFGHDYIFHAPYILFYLNDKNDLMPICIQLTRNNDVNRIYFPDGSYVWLWAKMLASNADGQYHENVLHLGGTHLALEPHIIAAHRQLAPEHAVLRLLLPHFEGTIAINNFGRHTFFAKRHALFERLLSAGLNGSLAIMEKAYNTFPLTELYTPASLLARGFPEIKPGVKDILPGYGYRDDAYQWWYALRNYVLSVLNRADVYHGSNEAMLRDSQLMAFLQELRDPDGAAVYGMPEVKTLDELADYLTYVIFTASCQHSAVNFGQADSYAFQAARPLIVTCSMPHDLSEVNEEFILGCLSDQETTDAIVLTVFTLALPAEKTLDPTHPGGVDQTFLDHIGIDPQFTAEYKRLVAVLDTLKTKIDERNANTWFPYIWLRPDLVASSINI